MESAVFAQTKTECQYHINESIQHCPYEDLKRYLRAL
jgi:hypothetical protein